MDLSPGVTKHGWQWKIPRTKCRCIAGRILELIVDFSITGLCLIAMNIMELSNLGKTIINHHL